MKTKQGKLYCPVCDTRLPLTLKTSPSANPTAFDVMLRCTRCKNEFELNIPSQQRL